MRRTQSGGLAVMLGALMLLVGSLMYCDMASVGAKEIPEDFRGQLEKDRTRDVAIQHDLDDLNRKLGELVTERNFLAAQEHTVSVEVLNALQLSDREYVVDLVKMKVVPLKH